MAADTSPPALSPERILMHALPALTGAYVLATAARCSLFTHLENGAGTAAGLADPAGISERGAQALLDGLTGIGLVESTDGGYRNSPEASLLPTNSWSAIACISSALSSTGLPHHLSNSRNRAASGSIFE